MTDMSQIHQIQELLKHADTVTAESRELRQQIEHIRAEAREWPPAPDASLSAAPIASRVSGPDFATSSSDGMTPLSPGRP